MFVTHRAVQGSALVAELGRVLRTPLDDPFAEDLVAVPAKGVERWIAQRLAHILGADGAQDGVCANVRFLSVTTLVDEVLQPFLPADAASSWAPDRLTWHLLDELEACPQDEAWCSALVRHLSGSTDTGRRMHTASKLARLFDSYGHSRPAMLQAWAAGRDEQGDGSPLDADLLWQAELWRRVRARIGLPAPAELLDKACHALRETGAAELLPSRVNVFGASRLSRARLRVLEALAEQHSVHLWLHHASPALWDVVTAVAPATRRGADTSAQTLRNPLLRSLSADVRELQQVLALEAPKAVSESHPSPPTPDTLLGRLQASLADDTAPAAPPALAATDNSVQVHACHGRTRQVEVLREVLLRLLEDDPTLEPSDIIVMCPDVETFAPLVAATFALGSEDTATHPAARLRVRLADRSPRQTNPLLSVLSLLLELGTARLTASQVLDLAGSPAVRQRFGYTDDDLARLHEWTAAAAVRWGLDAQHRAGWHLGGLAQGTWREGLDRLLTGVVTEASPDDVSALDDVDSAAIELAGRFCEMVDRLAATVTGFGAPKTAAAWADLLEQSVLALATAAPGGAWQEVQLRAVVADLREHASASEALLGLGDIRALFASSLAGRPTRASFRTGTLTVCTLVPMRSVPHKVVCLLGLDDGTFPRQSSRDGDDVLARAPWVGERSPGAEDRQLLLDAVCAAGQHLVVTYTGSDPRTGVAVPPAVPLGELLDALDRTGRVEGGRVRDQVTTRHPLQPFDPRNFTAGALAVEGPFSFDPLGHDAAVAAAGPSSPPPALLGPPLAAPVPTDITLVDLLRLLEHPARGFLRQRLDVAVERSQDDLLDALPVALDDLARYAAAERILQDRLRGLDPAQSRLRERHRGTLPPGQLGEAALADAADRAEQVVAASAAERSLPPESFDVDLALDDGTRLLGTVANVRGTVLLSTSCATLSARHRLRAWVQLVVLTAARPDQPWRAVAVGRSGRSVVRSQLGPVPPPQARALAGQLVTLHRAGLATPLPLPVKTAGEYALMRGRGRSVDLARAQAAKKWVGDRFPGESADGEHVLLYGPDAPVTVLTGQPVLPGDSAATSASDETDRFGLLARLLWQPLLDHETTAQA